MFLGYVSWGYVTVSIVFQHCSSISYLSLYSREGFAPISLKPADLVWSNFCCAADCRLLALSDYVCNIIQSSIQPTITGLSSITLYTSILSTGQQQNGGFWPSAL